MFTGIVTDLGHVRRLVRGPASDGGIELKIPTRYHTPGIPLRGFNARSGPCLTVGAADARSVVLHASAETLACSTLGEWDEGSPVNLERALRVGDELGGHIVSGHVDGVARLVERRPDGESVRLTIEAPAELMSYIASKGSVALDGVSLTVNELDGTRFGVNIIPYTLEHTGFGRAKPGKRMNLEIDPIARYVARLLGAREQDPRGSKA